MWHQIQGTNILPEAWRKVDTNGRIIGRVNLKEGEYSASKIVIDDEGIGHAKHCGYFLTLDNAKAAIDS